MTNPLINKMKLDPLVAAAMDNIAAHHQKLIICNIDVVKEILTKKLEELPPLLGIYEDNPVYIEIINARLKGTL